MVVSLAPAPGVMLRCVKDARFRQGCLSFQFVRQMQEAEAAMNALLPAVWLRGTARYPDLRSITRRLDELYGASVSPLVRRVGDYQTVGLYCGFMDDRFALPGERVLEPLMEVLEELLMESILADGAFEPEFVESEKDNLIATIEAELNDKRAYAMGRLLRNMCQGDSFGIPRLGEKEWVRSIRPDALGRHYKKLRRESPVEIFYVGSREPEKVARLLSPLLSRLPREPEAVPDQTPLSPGPDSHCAESMDVTQGKLCLGYTTPITNRGEDFAAMQVMNTIFGAGMTSKLFQNVREKLSLCYSVGSAYYGSKGLVTVAAGIDFDKEEAARQEIGRQLAACQAGDITGEELTAGKEAILSSLRATQDSPGAIEGYYATAALSGMTMDVQTYAGKVSAVTKEQVVRAANTVRLHSSFFLKGGQPC